MTRILMTRILMTRMGGSEAVDAAAVEKFDLILMVLAPPPSPP